VIVADQSTHRVRKIAPDATVTTLAGNGNAGFADAAGTNASFYNPYGVAVDGDGSIIVADQSNHRIRKIAASLVPPPSLVCLPLLPSTYTQQMAALLDDESHADVTFLVGQTRITAHRVLLITRSEYFATMLTSGFSEATGGEPIQVGETTPEAFRALLRYLYTDELVFDDEHVIDVMRKAKEMTLERVYNYTVRRCTRGISVYNVVGWFVQADEYGLDELRNSTFRFLAHNFRQVKAQARNTLQALSTKPTLLMEVMLEAI